MVSKGAKAVNAARAVKSAASNSNEGSNSLFSGAKVIILSILGTLSGFIIIPFIFILITGATIFGFPAVLFADTYGTVGGSSSGGDGANGNYSGDIGYIQWAIDIANDDSHGYSQCARTGPDYDCSSLVYYSLINAGFTTEQLGSYPFTTATMPTVLPQAGFVRHSFVQSELQAGDILWRSGHTAMYIGNDQIVHASGPEGGGLCGSAGDQTGKEILVQGIAGSGPWTAYYRRA